MMKDNKKLKIVWICHFAKKNITEILKDKGVINKGKNINEFATWINTLTSLFEDHTDQIELHIVAPYKGLKKHTSLVHNNVHYYFINTGIFNTGRNWPRQFFPFDYISNFYLTKRKAKKIITAINPDLIHMHGAENAYYSSWMFPLLNKYQILLTVQGFLFLENHKKTYIIRRKLDIENLLYKKIHQITIRTTFMKEVMQKVNQNAKLYDIIYPLPPVDPKYTATQNKKYDFIFYGRVMKTKGIEDTLNAFGKLVEKKPDLLLGIVGGANKDYLDYLLELCNKLKITKNIEFLGYFPSLNKAHEIVSTGKILVLPTYFDVIPGTIIEAMFMKIPVIAYKSGGIPDLNKEDEVVKLADRGNVEQLAEYMELLVNNKEYADELALKGYNKIHELLNQHRVFNDYYNCYNEVIKDFNIENAN